VRLRTIIPSVQIGVDVGFAGVPLAIVVRIDVGLATIPVAVAVGVGKRLAVAEQVDAAADDDVPLDAVAGLADAAEDGVVPDRDVLFRHLRHGPHAALYGPRADVRGARGFDHDLARVGSAAVIGRDEIAALVRDTLGHPIDLVHA